MRKKGRLFFYIVKLVMAMEYTAVHRVDGYRMRVCCSSIGLMIIPRKREIGEDDADDDDDEQRCNVGMENNEMTSASGSG